MQGACCPLATAYRNFEACEGMLESLSVKQLAGHFALRRQADGLSVDVLASAVIVGAMVLAYNRYHQHEVREGIATERVGSKVRKLTASLGGGMRLGSLRLG